MKFALLILVLLVAVVGFGLQADSMPRAAVISHRVNDCPDGRCPNGVCPRVPQSERTWRDELLQDKSIDMEATHAVDLVQYEPKSEGGPQESGWHQVNVRQDYSDQNQRRGFRLRR